MSINSGAVRNGTFKKNLQRLYVSTAILTVLSIPALAQQVIADGTGEIVAPGTVIDTGMAGGSQASGLSAKNGGSIVADGPVSITTGGYAANGVTAADGGTITVTGATIKTSGAMALGILVSHDSAVVATNIDISTSGQYSHGVGVYYTGTYTQNGGSISTTGNNAAGYQIQRGGTADVTGVTVTTAGTGADGVQLLNDGSSLKMQDSSISTSGANAIGVSAANAVLADLIDTTITTSGNGAHGVLAQAGATVNASNVDVTTSGDNAKGVLVDGVGSTVDFTGGSIKTSGQYSDAVNVSNGGSIKLDGTYIEVNGPNSDGVVAGLDGTATVKNSQIVANHDSTHAVWANGGDIAISNTAIDTHGDYGRGFFLDADGTIDADHVAINTEGKVSHGIQMNSGKVTMRNSSITTEGLGAIGVWSAGGEADLIDTSVETAGDQSHAAQVSNGGSLSATNSTFATTGSEANAIQVNGFTAASNTVTLNNVLLSAAQGASVAVDTATADITLKDSQATANNGTWLDIRNGATANVALEGSSVAGIVNTEAGSVSNLSLDETSHWAMTGDSSVTDLINNGMIAFDAEDPYKTLTAGMLSMDGGSFVLNTKLNEGGASSETDKLVVTGDTSGHGLIYVRNNGGTGAYTGTGATDGIQVVEVGGASDAEFVLGAAAVVGIYDYQLAQADGQNWYLQTDGSDPSGHIVDTVPGYNVALAGAREHILTSLDTFHERVGELRLNPEDEGFHAWMRGLGKTGSYAPDVTGHASQGFNLSTAGMQIGSDYNAIGVINADDKFTVGVFGELAQSSFDVKGRTASGSIASKGLGAYASWQEHAPTATTPGTGFYVDAVVKHDWLDFGVSARSVSGFDIGHSYSGSATSASIEAGYGFYLGDNLVLQPQAQLIYSSVNADSFMDGNGIVVHGQQTESLLGRVGLRLEKTYYFGEATKPETVRSVTTFVDANVKHEFMGKSSLVASDTLISSDMGGTSFEVGVGAVAQISDNVSLFGRASVEFGGATELAGKVTGGLKITW